MPEDLKKAVFAEWTGWECTIRRITFEIEDEKVRLLLPKT
jgi:hypothetical protein